MTLFLISLVAGALTILAPCILPLLPVVIGGSLRGDKSKWTPYIIIGALSASVIIFTLLLKATTAFIDIPREVWSYISGGILIFFGATMILPGLWERLEMIFGNIGAKIGISKGAANKAVAEGAQKKSVWGDVMVGAALGPVFSSCSPTYAVIIAVVLPQSVAQGMIYLLAYVAGLSAMLLLVAIFGQKITAKLSGVADPRSWFKKGLGILFLLVGIAVISGYDKKFEGAILDTGFYDGISGLEGDLIDRVDPEFFK